jgi:hypothetical protein
MSAIDNRLLRNPPLLGVFSTLETTCLPFAPLPLRQRTSDKAVVTWVAGEKAYQWFSVTGPAMQRYATRVGADLVVLDGFGGQPYALANKFRVKQVITEYGYDRVLYVDADALVQDHCVDFFSLVPADHIGILDEGLLYDEWALAQYRREALSLAMSQGRPLTHAEVPSSYNSGLYHLPARYAAVLDPPAAPFPLCVRDGATVEQTWLTLQIAASGAPVFKLDNNHHWLWYTDQTEVQAADAMVLHFAGLGNNATARHRRLLHYASRSKGRLRDGRALFPSGHFDRQFALHAPAEPALRIRNLRSVGTHQHGWAVATKAISVLANPDGVLFDDFVESSFLWHGTESFANGEIPYREHWTGFVHTPPYSPDWPSIEGEKITNLPRNKYWLEGLENCLGLFAMTEYLAKWVTSEWSVPCEVVRYPAIRPQRVFDWDRFVTSSRTVACVGVWLRRFSSFAMLSAPGYRKLRPLPVERTNASGIEHLRAYIRDEAANPKYPGSPTQPVHVCDRLDADAYDALLATSVVFLDLIDASAVTTVVECLVRGTPLLINRIEPVEEYLGADYPLYFGSLEEATSQLGDLELLRAAHEHMLANPIQMELRPQTFLDRMTTTATYHRALESSAARRQYGR